MSPLPNRALFQDMQIYNIKPYAVDLKSSGVMQCLTQVCVTAYQRGAWSKPQALGSPAWSLFLDRKTEKLCRRERACISDDISLCFCFAWSRLDGALLHACSARRAPSVPAEASGNSGPSPQNKEHLSEGDLNFTPQCLHLLTNWISLAVISVVKLLLLSFHRSWVTCRRV